MNDILITCTSVELVELSRLQAIRARRVNHRWWPGKFLLINWRIMRAIRRVQAITFVRLP